MKNYSREGNYCSLEDLKKFYNQKKAQQKALLKLLEALNKQK